MFEKFEYKINIKLLKAQYLESGIILRYKIK